MLYHYLVFQSTLPRRERLRITRSMSDAGYFNPRSHEGSDTPEIANCDTTQDFNPRSHEGSDSFWPIHGTELFISIHAPTKGATVVPAVALMLRLFQSTLPRRERRPDGSCKYRYDRISIHAPTKGATVVERIHITKSKISIHAPTKGATKTPYDVSGFKAISIHAPTKGATLWRDLHWTQGRHFNPRSHEGSDRKMIFRKCCFSHFNPRSHEGSDSGASDTRPLRQHFNPRSHEGSDSRKDTNHGEIYLFQSTLPRRERLLKRRVYCIFIRFQSTLPRRERLHEKAARSVVRKFQSTLPRRERPCFGCMASNLPIFQSTLPRRERLTSKVFRLVELYISIHAPTKGATYDL